MKHYLTISCLQAFAGDSMDPGVTETAAGSQPTGEEIAPAAGVQEDRREEFDRLVSGEFKEAFDERVQDIIQKRLRSVKDSQAALKPALDLLAQKYGTAPGDAAALTAALEREAQPARQQSEAWVRQSLEARQRYPGFDLGRELSNPRFRQLLRSDVDVVTAYEVLHREEFLRSAMAYTANAVQQRIAGSIASGDRRPMENGSCAQGAATARVDVSRMTPAQRQDIIRRAQRGERITF